MGLAQGVQQLFGAGVALGGLMGQGFGYHRGQLPAHAGEGRDGFALHPPAQGLGPGQL